MDRIDAGPRRLRGSTILRSIGLFFLFFPILLEASSKIQVASSPRLDIGASEPIAPTFLSVAATPPSSDALPCFDCVAGESAPTIGIPAPVQVVTSGEDLTFTLAIGDFDFTGACSVGFTLRVNSSVTQTYTYDLPSGCTAQTNYLISWQTNIGGLTSPGSAEIEAKVTTVGVPRSMTYYFRTTAATLSIPVVFTIAAAEPAVSGVVPCLNCVTGATSPTVGLPVPLAALVLGQEYHIISMATDASFTGTCGLGNAVRQNGVTHPLNDANEFACSPGSSAFAVGPLVVNELGAIFAVGTAYTVTDNVRTPISEGNDIEIKIW